MAAAAGQDVPAFDPSSIEAFRFLGRELDPQGHVRLEYALDGLRFVERFELPLSASLSAAQVARADGLLALLHWVAGVSYFKAALPGEVLCESGPPGPRTAALLEALYSEGLGELAFRNRLARLPRPVFPRSDAAAGSPGPAEPRRVLVPVGGGKDSVVALEIVRRSGLEPALFSIGDAAPIRRTAAAARLQHLIARRRIDPELLALNRRGAINGHVPVTAIVASAAALTAALNGFDTVALANERSASAGNLSWDGVEVNHQFSKGLRVERLLRGALAEAGGEVDAFSVLRPASELAIARTFARLEAYHDAFTSCNAIFRLDPELRAGSWCCECPKCRFVYLILAPYMEPQRLRAIFGRDLLAEEEQLEGFQLLAASGGHKPFECVGEEQESLAAMRLLAADPRWRGHAVVSRLAAGLLQETEEGDAAEVLALRDEHEIPEALRAQVSALLGS